MTPRFARRDERTESGGAALALLPLALPRGRPGDVNLDIIGSVSESDPGATAAAAALVDGTAEITVSADSTGDDLDRYKAFPKPRRGGRPRLLGVGGAEAASSSKLSCMASSSEL